MKGIKPFNQPSQYKSSRNKQSKEQKWNRGIKDKNVTEHKELRTSCSSTFEKKKSRKYVDLYIKKIAQICIPEKEILNSTY